MKNAVLMIASILAVVCLAGPAHAGDPFAVGEKWTYKHEGAIPMRPPDTTMSGDRIREVVGVKGEGKEKRWLILEAWGNDDQWAGKRYVCADRMYDRMEGGGDMIMTIKPATLFDGLNLKPDEEKSIECTFEVSADMSFPIKYTIKRVKDQTVKVPAGEFENCICVKSEEAITFSPPNGGDGMTITTKREQWYHPKVNGLVKEIFTILGPGGEDQKGTSELKSYTKEKKE